MMLVQLSLLDLIEWARRPVLVFLMQKMTRVMMVPLLAT
jgi:hypothetical protein